MVFFFCRHITRIFYRKLLCSSHWRIHQRTVAPATDRHKHPSYQVSFSVILKLGHTQRNQQRVVTTVTDRRWGTVAWLMRYTRHDPAGPFFKIRPFKLPNPSFHPHYFIISPITLSFSTTTIYSSINHRSFPPTIIQSPKSVNLLAGAAAVGVCLATEYLSICFSPFLRYVSLISTHLSCIFVY